MKIKSVNFAQKLILFIITLFFVLVLASFMLVNSINKIYQSNAQNEIYSNLLVDFQEVKFLIANSSANGPNFKTKEIEEKLNLLKQKITQIQVTTPEKKEISDLLKNVDSIKYLVLDISNLKQQNENDVFLKNGYLEKLNLLNQNFKSSEKQIQRNKENLLIVNEHLKRNILIEIYAIAILFFLVIGLTIIVIRKRLLNSLKSVNELILKLAEGDFSGKTKINDSRNDEIGTVLKNLKKMETNIRNFLYTLQRPSNEIADGCNQFAVVAQQISSGAESSASSTEEVASSIEQLSAAIKQNNENSESANKIAQESAIKAQQGVEAVNNTVGAMSTISAKISIIEDIAYQTNLLALNAAIEAARAGEAGRGFSVVASEIRKLAENSQKAAGEITKISSNSMEIATEAGDLIINVLPEIKQTADLIQKITKSSNEQSYGAEQINLAIQQLDSVIQQNALASKEMATLSEEMSTHSNKMIDTILHFKMNENIQDEDSLVEEMKTEKIAEKKIEPARVNKIASTEKSAFVTQNEKKEELKTFEQNQKKIDANFSKEKIQTKKSFNSQVNENSQKIHQKEKSFSNKDLSEKIIDKQKNDSPLMAESPAPKLNEGLENKNLTEDKTKTIDKTISKEKENISVNKDQSGPQKTQTVSPVKSKSAIVQNKKVKKENVNGIVLNMTTMDDDHDFEKY